MLSAAFPHVFHEQALRAALEMMTRRYEPNRSPAVLTCDRNELASRLRLYRHGRYRRNTHPGRDHGKDRRELAAFEYDARRHPQLVTRCNQAVTKAVALFQEEKRFAIQLRQIDRGA